MTNITEKKSTKLKNLADTYHVYVTRNIDNQQVISNINTALIRYTLPELGFVIPERSKKRFHHDDIKLAIKFLSEISLDENIGTSLLKAQEKILLLAQMSLPNKRQQKMNLKKFISFIEVSKEGTKPLVKNERKREFTYQRVADFSHISNATKKRKNKDKIALSFSENDYEGNDKFNRKQLKRIEKEIRNFEDFLPSIQNSKISIINDIRHVKALLGWLYLQSKSLKNISLSNLIPVCDIYPKRYKFNNINDYYIEKYSKEQEAKDIAKEVLIFVKDFFRKYQVEKKGTKIAYTKALVNVAKFLYKDITDQDEYENYQDISVIRQLRIYNNRIPNDSNKIELPLPSWETIILCLKEFKRRANLERRATGVIKEQETLAKHLQRFLILGMFTLIPPPRQRVVRELRIGETIKHGSYKDGVFIPREKLSNPEEAKYYIHLQPEDYKTGNKYGEWLGEFPNEQFDDGTNFYQYLDKWIYGGFREILLREQTHNYLFVKDRSGEPLGQQDMGHKVSKIFESAIKQKISPHKLRTIYRTHLEDIGANQKVLNSSSFWMRHSPEIGRKIYTKQSLDNKLKPGLEMISAINGKLLSAPHASS